MVFKFGKISLKPCDKTCNSFLLKSRYSTEEPRRGSNSKLTSKSQRFAWEFFSTSVLRGFPCKAQNIFGDEYDPHCQSVTVLVVWKTSSPSQAEINSPHASLATKFYVLQHLIIIGYHSHFVF